MARQRTPQKAIRRTLLRAGSAAKLTDGQLLARFVASQEQVALQELIRRHGPMVLQICQRVLRRAEQAEEAFQATFIVLAHNGRAVAKMGSVATWLQVVAYRTAVAAKRRDAGLLASTR